MRPKYWRSVSRFRKCMTLIYFDTICFHLYTFRVTNLWWFIWTTFKQRSLNLVWGRQHKFTYCIGLAQKCLPQADMAVNPVPAHNISWCDTLGACRAAVFRRKKYIIIENIENWGRAEGRGGPKAGPTTLTINRKRVGCEQSQSEESTPYTMEWPQFIQTQDKTNVK